MRGALIGVGNVALHGHLPGWLERRDVRLAAGADPRDGGREEFLARVPAARWHASAERLLEEERPDFVDICTPPGLHAPLAVLALSRGAHVLCEKPLVLSREELDRVRSAARRAGRVVQTVHNWRHAPAMRRVRDLLRSGSAGRIRSWSWETLRAGPAAAAQEGPSNWRLDPALAGGGILADHGWHALYLLHEWLGGEPVRLRARLERRAAGASPLEDTATLELEYPEARASVFLTWASDRRANRLEIEGEAGRILLDGSRVAFYPNDSAAPVTVFDVPLLCAGSQHPDWFTGVVEGFLAEVRGRVPAGANLAESEFCVDLLACARESGRRDAAWLPFAR
jgi:predicted dehydrogenase